MQDRRRNVLLRNHPRLADLIQEARRRISEGKLSVSFILRSLPEEVRRSPGVRAHLWYVFGGGARSVRRDLAEPLTKALLRILSGVEQLENASLEQPHDVWQLLRILRAKYGISRSDLARILGVSYTCVFNWECQHRTPSAEIFVARYGEKLKAAFHLQSLEVVEGPYWSRICAIPNNSSCSAAHVP